MSIIIFLLISTSILKLLLIWRQKQYIINSYKDANLEQTKVSQYNINKLNMAIVEWFADIGLICLWLFVGGVFLLEKRLVLSHHGSLFQVLIFFGVIFLSRQLLNILLSYLRVFLLERRYNFTTMSFSHFIILSLKQLLLLLLYFLVLTPIILYFYKHTQWWWLLTWLIFTSALLIIEYLYPLVIAPYFYKFTKLNHPQLESHLNKLFNDNGFGCEGVYLKDHVRYSTHVNAYVTGLAKQKRIILFDTLFKSLPEFEIEAIVAHEVGHLAHHDIIKYISLQAISGLCVLLVIGYLLSQGLWQFYSPIVTTPFGAIAILYLLTPIFIFLTLPLKNHVLRHFEYAADYFAAKSGYARNLAQSLRSLAKLNAALVNADYWFMIWFYTHPTIATRIKILEEYIPSSL